MPTTPHNDMLVALRAFLLSILPAGTEVILFQANRAPEPAGNFVMMTPLRLPRLSTNLDDFTGAQTNITQAMQADTQLDFHSADQITSAEMATTVSTLFRSWVATEAFENSGYAVAPLYAGDPVQRPFINAEQQYETRWVVDVSLQVNATTIQPL